MGVGGGLDSRSTPSSRGYRGLGFRCCSRPEEFYFFERIGRNHQASQEDPHPRGVKRGGEWDVGENTGDVNQYQSPPVTEAGGFFDRETSEFTKNICLTVMGDFAY